MSDSRIKKYPKTDLFEIVDTIGVPHPFCITPKHIEAAQKYGGMLGNEAIEDLERNTNGPSCGVRGCNLMFDQHETALLVACKSKDNAKLKEYLLSIVAMAEEDKFAGFAFLDKTN